MAYLARTFKTPVDRILMELEEWLGVELPTEIVFAYPTPAELARHVAERHMSESSAKGPVG